MLWKWREEWIESGEPQTGEEQLQELNCYAASKIQKGHKGLSRPVASASLPNVTESNVRVQR